MNTVDLLKYQFLFLHIQLQLYEVSDKFNNMKDFQDYILKEFTKTEFIREISDINKLTEDDIKIRINNMLSEMEEHWKSIDISKIRINDGSKGRRRVLDKSIGKKVSNKRRLSVRRGSRRGVISRRRR